MWAKFYRRSYLVRPVLTTFCQLTVDRFYNSRSQDPLWELLHHLCVTNAVRDYGISYFSTALMLSDICLTWICPGRRDSRADSLSDLWASCTFLWLNWKLHDTDLNKVVLCNNSFLFLVWHVIELQGGMHLQQVPLTLCRHEGLHVHPQYPPSAPKPEVCQGNLIPVQTLVHSLDCCCLQSPLVHPWDFQRCPSKSFECVRVHVYVCASVCVCSLFLHGLHNITTTNILPCVYTEKTH